MASDKQHIIKAQRERLQAAKKVLKELLGKEQYSLIHTVGLNGDTIIAKTSLGEAGEKLILASLSERKLIGAQG